MPGYYRKPAPSRGGYREGGGGAQPGAGRPGTQADLDPLLLQSLAINANGATSAELAMYLESTPEIVRARLRQLEAQGRVFSFPDPMQPRAKLWGFPELTKLPPTVRAPQQKKGPRLR